MALTEEFKKEANKFFDELKELQDKLFTEKELAKLIKDKNELWL
jgi:hypothetical protein